MGKLKSIPVKNLFYQLGKLTPEIYVSLGNKRLIYETNFLQDLTWIYLILPIFTKIYFKYFLIHKPV